MGGLGGQGRIGGFALVNDDEFAGNLITLEDGLDGREQEFRPVARRDDEGRCGQARREGRTAHLFRILSRKSDTNSWLLYRLTIRTPDQGRGVCLFGLSGLALRQQAPNGSGEDPESNHGITTPQTKALEQIGARGAPM